MKVSNAEWSSYRITANYFLGYVYAGPSNFGHFGQIFWRVIYPYARKRKPRSFK